MIWGTCALTATGNTVPGHTGNVIAEFCWSVERMRPIPPSNASRHSLTWRAFQTSEAAPACLGRNLMKNY